jgi:hypothetical protein
LKPISETVSPRPFTLEKSATAISLLATVKGKTLKQVQAQVCLINRKGREDAEANAEFLLRAANTLDSALKVCSYLWNARTQIDDSGCGKQPNEPVVHTQELEEIIELAGDICHDALDFDPKLPRGPKPDPRFDNRANVRDDIGGPDEGSKLSSNDPALPVTPDKIAAFQRGEPWVK